jgi:glycosyltransferase involved in cell wall biosynthesis
MCPPSHRVSAVVATFNRRSLLEQTLNCLYGQTHPLEQIIVVENCSTDDTPEFRADTKIANLQVVLMQSNVGGAGGFSVGLERAYDLGSDPQGHEPGRTIAYYPIPRDDNKALHDRYVAAAEHEFPNTTVAGRLGDYQHCNMDQARAG